MFIFKTTKNKQAVQSVYFITEIPYSGCVKIGMTRGPVEKRMKQLQTGNPRKLCIIAVVYVRDALAVEKQLHKKYTTRHNFGEWYNFDNSELPKLIKEESAIKYIPCNVTTASVKPSKPNQQLPVKWSFVRWILNCCGSRLRCV